MPEKKIYTLTSARNDRVFIHVMPGHFVSANNHINYYIGTSDIKHNHRVSVDAAMLLSSYYNENNIEVDTVLCLYETQPLGAFLAHELSRPNMMSPNPNQTVYTIGAEYDAAGNLIFRDNLVRMIKDKNVVVLISCITSGRTVERAMESIEYYGGRVAGVSSVFSAVEKIRGIFVNTLFTGEDVPSYRAYPAHNCPYCAQGIPVDAISNGYGYSKL
ncbi:MAG: orotate phosphoribosyltransferase [Eubacterium sp.]|nr:orotate phosphoribosyltransferase [Eubacterium sp.]